MSKLEDEIYTSHKAEYIILITAGTIIGFFWKFLPDILPFAESIELPKMYLLEAVSTLLIMLLALGSYIIYLRKNPKYNRITQEQAEDSQRKKLGVFLLEENERLKKEHQELLNRPKPSRPEVFFQMKEQGRFLDGQHEILERLSKFIIPPNMK